MFRRLLVGLVALAGLTAFAPAPPPRPSRQVDAKALLKSLQGTWEVTGVERGGAAGKVANRPAMRVRIEGQRWSFIYNFANGGPGAGGPGGTSLAYELKLDTSKSPALMDLQRSEAGGLTVSGIVKVEGDTLKFCYGPTSRVGAKAAMKSAARPTSFDRMETGHILMTLKRVKP